MEDSSGEVARVETMDTSRPMKESAIALFILMDSTHAGSSQTFDPHIFSVVPIAVLGISLTPTPYENSPPAIATKLLRIPLLLHPERRGTVTGRQATADQAGHAPLQR